MSEAMSLEEAGVQKSRAVPDGQGGSRPAPVAATAVMPQFPSLERLSNDNSKDAIGSLPVTSVGFEGALSHYRLAVLAILACAGAAAFFMFERGVEPVISDPRAVNFALIGLVVIATLFLWGFMRRRSVRV